MPANRTAADFLWWLKKYCVDNSTRGFGFVRDWARCVQSIGVLKLAAQLQLKSGFRGGTILCIEVFVEFSC